MMCGLLTVGAVNYPTECQPEKNRRRRTKAVQTKMRR